MPWPAPVTMAILFSSRNMALMKVAQPLAGKKELFHLRRRPITSILVLDLLVRQRLSPAADLRPRDGRARKIGEVKFVEVLPAERHVRRAAQQDRPSVPREQRSLPRRADAPDFVGRVAADVKITVRVEGQAVGEAAAIGRAKFRRARRAVGANL